MTLRELLHVIWSGRGYALAALLVVVAVAWVYTDRQIVDYRATAVVELGEATSGTETVTPDGSPATVTSEPVLARAAEQLGVPELSAAGLSATYDSGSRRMAVMAVTPDAERSVATANAVAQAYADELPAVIERQVEALDEQIDAVSEQVRSARATLRGQADDPVATALDEAGGAQLTALTGTRTAFLSLVTPGQVVAPAQAAEAQAPGRTTVLAAALLAGLLAGVGAALLRHGLDTRVRSAAQAAELTQAPVLAELSGVRRAMRSAREGRMPVATRLATPFTESVRELRTAVQVGLGHRPHVAVVVSAADPRAPRAFVAANLAVSFALSGRRTVVLAGDMRRPQIEDMLPPPEGWSGARGELRPTRVPHLEVCPMPDVELDPADFLATEAAQDLVQRLSRAADIVVVDAPPVLAAADAAILGAYTSGVVLVADAAGTDRVVLTQAAERLRTNGVPLLGVVVAGRAGSRRTEYAATYGDADSTPAQPQGDDAEARTGVGAPLGRVADDEAAEAAGQPDPLPTVSQPVRRTA
ncbi:polysaccharide biosynthesis tyrosine autokinase [Puerhibacterium puerhi]|uniref:polysaccharide biosynthesis tyrosine autokinase n=1 Tax=Puerhibacterium puerhi TaxID=2692623 RepID=UPI00135A293E|nr:CpsD/CapB family tyrosine-protein kinase [Puerhibacterium puerhi]